MDCDGESRTLFIGGGKWDYFDFDGPAPSSAQCKAVSQYFLGNVTVVPQFWTEGGHWCVLVVKMA